jgi:hypothetical protein
MPLSAVWSQMGLVISSAAADKNIHIGDDPNTEQEAIKELQDKFVLDLRIVWWRMNIAN